MPGLNKIFRVDDVDVAMLSSDPVRICITAHGTAPTGGWSEPTLSPYVYVVPPKDGLQDFDFVAKPPSGPAIQVLTPLTVHHVVENPPAWICGVRVHASSNSKEALLGKRPCGQDKVCIKGTLTDEGVECQAMRSENNELFTLVGDLSGLKVGDTVFVSGTIAQFSFCMQGRTIAVDWISKSKPKC